LYGAVWASYWLYSFIDLQAAGWLMGAISLGLMGLALRHGEPLAMLAVGGAMLAPAITGPQHWSAPALTAYLLVMIITVYAVAGCRRWGPAGLTALAAAALWGAAGIPAEGYDRTAALAIGPVLLSIAVVEWRRRRGDAVEAADAFGRLVAASLGAAAV